MHHPPSSVLGESDSDDADDGDKNCAMVAKGAKNWWAAKLEKASVISSVKIYGRLDQVRKYL